MNFHDEPNGNVAPREFSEENDVNDNIGNRLQPGEASVSGTIAKMIDCFRPKWKAQV